MDVKNLNDIYRGKRVLVTGDTGFKGSWLSLWLTHMGAHVTGFSLEPRTRNDNYVVSGVEDLISHVTGDVRDYPHLLQVFESFQPNLVFHLAAQPIVLESYQDPITTFSTNVMGTVHVLEAARHTPSVSAVVIVTSDKCYENSGELRSFREGDPLGGHDPYSASKGAAEIITLSYIRSFFGDGRAAVASVRAGNVIGGGDWAPNRLLPDCIHALKGDQPVLVRNPKAVRPWQHVLDPLHGYLMLGACLVTQGSPYCGAWNFGPFQNRAVPVLEVVQGVIDEWGGGTFVVEGQPSANQEANWLQLDVTKAANRLGWVPVLDVGESIRWAVEEYKIEGMDTAGVRAQRVAHINRYSEKFCVLVGS